MKFHVMINRLLKNCVAAISIFYTADCLAGERITNDGYLAFPYDGKVTSADLLSHGHNMDVLYTELYRLAAPLKRDEFETTTKFIKRSNLVDRQDEFFAKYGEEFLYIDELDNKYALKYDADNQEMRFFIPAITIGLGLSKKELVDLTGYSESSNYISNSRLYGASCDLDTKIPLSTDRAKAMKFGRNLGMAIKFRIARVSPKMWEAGDAYNAKSNMYSAKRSNIRTSKKIKMNTGFYTEYNSYWRVAKDVNTLPEEFISINTNWHAAEIYIFDKGDGAAIIHKNCSVHYKR